MKKIVTKGEESVTPSTVIAAEVLYDDVTSKLTFSNTMFQFVTPQANVYTIINQNPYQDHTEVLKDEPEPKRDCDDIDHETTNLLHPKVNQCEEKFKLEFNEFNEICSSSVVKLII